MLFQQAGYWILTQSGITASFIALGILIESAFRRIASSGLPSPSGWNRIFNCKCAAALIVWRGSVELVYAGLLALAIEAWSPRPLFGVRSGIPFAVSVALLYSILGDFFYYWFHRWQHFSRWLWPMHELHHEDEHVNVTSAFKFHWIDSLAIRTVQVLPAIFLPRPLVTIPLISLAQTVRTAFEHLAIPLQLGPLNRLFTSPANHRIHHSKLPEHCNKNFAAVWPFWDVLFGTYGAPKREEYPPTGLFSGKVSKTVKDAFFAPLKVARKA